MRSKTLPSFTAALVLLLLAACGDSGGGGGSASAKRWPGVQWEVSTPAAEGMDATQLAAARDYAFAPGRNTQGVVVVRNGAIVAEWYDGGVDDTTLATSWSMAKSFSGTLVGIAIDRGDIPNLDVSLADYFPQYVGTDNARVTLHDLLEMRSGILWNEAAQDAMLYGNNVDQLAYALDRPLAHDPGTFWNYSSADSMLISGVISAATGRSTIDYANEFLFRPIGMAHEWWTDAAGHALTYCCLDAPTREYARFGLLFARGGEWNGKQVVSKTWVEQATKPLDGAPFYALQWWTNAGGVLAASVPSEMFAARGLFSQDIYIVPSLDLVVVRNGTYHRSGDGSTVRTGGNAHSTLPPNEWDVEPFLGPIVASIGASNAASARPASPASASDVEATRAAERAAGLR